MLRFIRRRRGLVRTDGATFDEGPAEPDDTGLLCAGTEQVVRGLVRHPPDELFGRVLWWRGRPHGVRVSDHRNMVGYGGSGRDLQDPAAGVVEPEHAG